MSNPFDCITDFIFAETKLAPADVILVPGANHPPLMEKAAFLYNQKLAPYILPSGGANQYINTTEWEFLQHIGIKNGVPEEFILKEDKAQNTFQNAHFSWDVLQKNGLHAEKVILVCKAAHSRRALLSYQSVFPKETEFFVSPVIDRYSITKENWFLSEVGIRRTMTEVEKIGKYFGHQIPNWIK